VEKRALRQPFWREKGKVTGEWRRIHNEDFYDLYPSTNISLGIESRRMKWVGYVACMGDSKGTYVV
jgi:hypothetical protein